MVAALAGVSRSTVSRVVNGSPRVTSEAAEAVNRAIAKLNYVPNRAARALASRKTQAIALVIPENTARFFADPFFASVSQGIAMHLATTDYTLSMLIASETDSGKTRRYLQGGNVDGALILSHHRDDRSYTHLATSIPVVFGGRPMSENGAKTMSSTSITSPPPALQRDTSSITAASASPPSRARRTWRPASIVLRVGSKRSKPPS